MSAHCLKITASLTIDIARTQNAIKQSKQTNLFNDTIYCICFTHVGPGCLI